MNLFGDAHVSVKLINALNRELFELKSPTVVIERPRDGSAAVELLLSAENANNRAEVRVVVQFHSATWLVWTCATILGVLGALLLCKRRGRHRSTDIELVHLV